jgi:hypothetical protein
MNGQALAALDALSGASFAGPYGGQDHLPM